MSGGPANEPLAVIRATRIVPVLASPSVESTVQTVGALASAQCNVAKVTLRSASAIDGLRAAASAFPDVAIGAGSVRDAASAEAAIEAGAAFLVSPGLSADVVRVASACRIAIIPGVATATEVMRALDLGLDLLKLFPAQTLGGVSLVSALAAPFPMVSFLPTGGIGQSHLASYLAHPRVAAVGGSWMAPQRAVDDGDFDEITRLTAAALDAARDASLAGATTS